MFVWLAALFIVRAHLVRGFSDSVLNLPGVFLDIARDLLAEVARDLAHAFLDGTLDFVLGTFATILVHACTPDSRLQLQPTSVLALQLCGCRDGEGRA